MGHLILCTAMVLLWATTALGSVLTLDECLQLARQRNSGLKSTSLQAAAAAQDVAVASSALLPSLKLKASYTLVNQADRLLINSDTFAPGVPSQNVSLSTGDRDNYSVALLVQQPLFTGGNLTHSKRKAEYLLAAAAHGVERQERLLVSMVTKAYNNLLAAGLREKSQEKTLQAKRERLRVTTERRLEGYAQQEDVMRLEADVAQGEALQVRALNRTALALSRLRELLQAGAGEEIQVAGVPTRISLTLPLDEAVQDGLRMREDLRGAKARLQQADEGIMVARSAFFPQLSMQGMYLRQKETGIARPEQWQMLAQAEWSIFEWGRTDAEVRKTVVQQQMQAHDVEEAAKSVRLDIEQAWRQVKEGESLVSAAERKLKAVEYALEKSLTRYQEGAVTLADLLDNEAEMWSVYDEYFQSATDEANAHAELELAVATSLNSWTKREKLHQPDFDRYAQQIVAAATSRLKQEMTPQLPQLAAPVLPPSATGGGTFRVQVGAFKDRHNAEQQANSIGQKIRGATVAIVSEGGLFKVLIGPFAKRQEAGAMAEGLVGKEYLVRIDHGP